MEGEHANKEEAAEVKKTSHKPGGHHNKHRKKHHKEDNAEKEGWSLASAEAQWEAPSQSLGAF